MDFVELDVVSDRGDQPIEFIVPAGLEFDIGLALNYQEGRRLTGVSVEAGKTLRELPSSDFVLEAETATPAAPTTGTLRMSVLDGGAPVSAAYGTYSVDVLAPGDGPDNPTATLVENPGEVQLPAGTYDLRVRYCALAVDQVCQRAVDEWIRGAVVEAGKTTEVMHHSDQGEVSAVRTAGDRPSTAPGLGWARTLPAAMAPPPLEATGRPDPPVPALAG
jgi:hypothetical protein